MKVSEVLKELIPMYRMIYVYGVVPNHLLDESMSLIDIDSIESIKILGKAEDLEEVFNSNDIDDGYGVYRIFCVKAYTWLGMMFITLVLSFRVYNNKFVWDCSYNDYKKFIAK